MRTWGRSAADRCRAAGHDVSTVPGEGTAGCTDPELFQGCAAESRGLVTLDLDFANPTHYDPEQSAGIAVPRVSDLPSQRHLLAALDQLLEALQQASISGRLWVVRKDRVRQYEPE